MPKLDLIHVIFNGGSTDESEGIVSLQRKSWLLFNRGAFSAYHANSQGGVPTLCITDSDFKLLLGDGDDPNSYRKLATWDHVLELLNCPAFRLERRLGGAE
jgi:hypothetical protein